MTAKFVVKTGCANQSGWTDFSGITVPINMNIGSVKNTNKKLDTGVETIVNLKQKASKAKGYNFMGQKASFIITGSYVASSLENAQNFERNLSLIADYQLETATPSLDTTFYYYNDKSVIYEVSQGIGVQVMMVNYSVIQSNTDNTITVHYTITLVNCRGI
jgi:hypothetical protein